MFKSKNWKKAWKWTEWKFSRNFHSVHLKLVLDEIFPLSFETGNNFLENNTPIKNISLCKAVVLLLFLLFQRLLVLTRDVKKQNISVKLLFVVLFTCLAAEADTKNFFGHLMNEFKCLVFFQSKIIKNSEKLQKTAISLISDFEYFAK